MPYYVIIKFSMLVITEYFETMFVARILYVEPCF